MPLRDRRLAGANSELGGPHGGPLDVSGDIPARPRQTCDEAGADGIAGPTKQHNRNVLCGLLYCDDSRRRISDDRINLEADEFCCQAGKATAISFGRPELEMCILTFRIAEVAQTARSMEPSGSGFSKLRIPIGHAAAAPISLTNCRLWTCTRETHTMRLRP